MASDTVDAVAAARMLVQLQSLQLPLDAWKVLRVEGFRNEIAPEVVLVRA